MKHRKLITLILASMALGALAGCGKNNETSSSPTSSSQQELPAEYSLMKYWAGNASEEFYDVTETDSQTVIEYEDVVGEDAGGWAYVSRSFQYDAEVRARFSEYKKFSFTGKLDVDAGSDVVMVKVQGAGGTFEKRFNFKSTTGTYEFSTSFISDWNQVDAILFFANRSTNDDGSGTITLDKFVLSKEAVDPNYDIAPGMPDVPQTFQYYDGSESFTAMHRWGYDDTGYVHTDAVAAGYKFSWSGVKQSEWAYVSALVAGGEEHSLKTSGLKRVVYTIDNGTAGQSVLFKVEDKVQGNANKVEKTIELTGSEQTVELDITGVLANEGFEDQIRLAIFPLPGLSGEQPGGEVTLKSAIFDKTAVVIPEEKNAVGYTQIWMEKVAVKDACYTVYNDTHKLTVAFAKQAPGYESLLLKVEDSEEWYVQGDQAKEYRRVVGKVTANVNVKVLLKPFDNGANEHWYTLSAGVTQDIDFTVDAETVDLTKSFVLFICAGDGEQVTNGQVLFDGLRLARQSVNVGFDDEVVLNRTGGCDGGYEFSLEGNNLVANYTFATVGWHQIEMYISAKDPTAYNKITGTITSTAASTLLIKPQDNSGNEIKINLEAGVGYNLEHVFNNPLDANWPKILMSLSNDEGDALTGKITFADFQLEIYDPGRVSTDPNPINMAGAYLDNWNFASDCYKLRKIDNGFKVILESGKAEGWENIQASFVKTEDWFDAGDFICNRISGTVVSTVNTHIILKPYDNGGAEHAFDLVANEPLAIDFTFDKGACDTTKNFILFVGTGGMAAGEVSFINLAMTHARTNVEDAEGKLYLDRAFFANDADFEIQSNLDHKGMSLEYHKVDGHEWEGVQLFCLSHDFATQKTLTLKGTAEKAVHLKFKLDGPNEEKEIVLAAGEFNETITFTNSIDGKWNKVLIFVAFDGGDAKTGTINFSQLYFAE